ncbi:7TM-DISM domain-containing protein [Lamprobacter modestohalophilus]|uniref:sensor histidine kinase n=1 Tax=Lamprobacter modestohalophilus TaxID=1064514 RepID=UPI002ADED97E|nr:ATP-binding protein [Lamprobacter modestohalophilus]MEA1051462.1 7TM-DISM domain-containing protein [Lamprobacter modestohalophilus]
MNSKTSPWLAPVLCACMLCLAAMAPLAQALDRITERAWFEDTSGQLGFTATRDREYRAFTGLLSRGFSRSAFWIRLRIEPGAPTPEGRLIVRVRPGYLDQITLHDPGFQLDGPITSGDRYPIDRDAYPSLYFNFAIPQGAAPRDIWLRLKTTSTNLIDVEALSPHQALQYDRVHELIFTPVLTLQLFFLLWGLLHWLQGREALLGAFMLKQSLGLLYALAYLGYFRLFWPGWLWPLSPSLLLTILIVLFAASAYYFDYRLLREFRPNPWLLGLFRMILPLFALALLLVALGDVGKALTLTNALVLVLPLHSLATAISISAHDPHPGEAPTLVPKPYVVILYVLIVISLSISTFPAMGLVPAGDWSFNGYLFYTLWTGLAVVILLQIRAQRLARRRAELEIAYRKAQQHSELETAKRQEMGRFLAMVMHELKTPLAIVRMVLGAAHRTPTLSMQADQAIDDMAAVIERCALADRLDNSMLKPQVTECDVEAQVHELVEHRPMPERFQLTGAAARIHTDSALLRMIITNLLDNAFKYSPPQSPISLRLEPAAQHGIDGIALEVANHPGKSGRPDPDRVFDRYYRHAKAHNVTGSGLGLFLCRGMARLIEGDIDYRPTPTHIRFRLWLPRSISC